MSSCAYIEASLEVKLPTHVNLQPPKSQQRERERERQPRERERERVRRQKIRKKSQKKGDRIAGSQETPCFCFWWLQSKGSKGLRKRRVRRSLATTWKSVLRRGTEVTQKSVCSFGSDSVSRGKCRGFVTLGVDV